MATQELAKFFDKIEEIVNVLSEEEILSLATTITGGLLKNKISTREDALKAVLNYSEDVRSILRRKVFTREKLMSYLYEKNISLKLPITKPEIVEKIVKLWTIDANDIIVCETNNSDYLSEEPQPPISCTQQTDNQQISEISTSDEDFSLVDEVRDSDDDTRKKVKLLAEQFSDWFYKLLNENELSPDHFFSDGCLHLILISDGVEDTKTVSNNPQDITDSLQIVKNQFNLFFNPNLMAGSLKAQMNAHGLVRIIVKGTLHIHSVCVGVFEQMFALARDPFAENNWKIKKTDLRLVNGSNNDVTSITHGTTYENS